MRERTQAFHDSFSKPADTLPGYLALWSHFKVLTIIIIIKTPLLGALENHHWKARPKRKHQTAPLESAATPDSI